MSNEIYKSLDLTPIENTDISFVEEPQSNIEQINNDFDFARDSLYKLIEAGKNAFDDLTVIAEQSQHPKAYDSLSNMLGQMINATDKLLDLQRKKQALHEKEGVGGAGGGVTNNLYVGTSEDLLKLLNNKNEEKKKDE